MSPALSLCMFVTTILLLAFLKTKIHDYTNTERITVTVIWQPSQFIYLYLLPIAITNIWAVRQHLALTCKKTFKPGREIKFIYSLLGAFCHTQEHFIYEGNQHNSAQWYPRAFCRLVTWPHLPKEEASMRWTLWKEFINRTVVLNPGTNL